MKNIQIDTRLHIAIESPRDLPGGHMINADRTIYCFQCAGYVGNTYYWKIADAKALLEQLKQLVGTTTILQSSPELLSEQEVHGFIHDLEQALQAKLTH